MAKRLEYQLKKVSFHCELEEALKDAKFCFDSFEQMQEIVQRVFAFARRFGAHT